MSNKIKHKKKQIRNEEQEEEGEVGHVGPGDVTCCV
jgi:hypothetical protein